MSAVRSWWRLAPLLTVFPWLLPACTTEPRRPTTTVEIFNLCGNVCNHGHGQSVSFAVSLARREQASVLLLQEACRTQVEDAARELEGTPVYVSTFVGDLHGLNECPGDDYGIGIVATAPVARSFELPMPNPGLGRDQIDARAFLCAELNLLGSSVTTCDTHLARTVAPDAHAAQVAAVIDNANRLSDTAAAPIVGGDFNEDLRPFGRLVTGRGAQYVTAPATQSSIDRVFVRRGRYRILSSRSFVCTCSDHRALIVKVALDQAG